MLTIKHNSSFLLKKRLRCCCSLTQRHYFRVHEDKTAPQNVQSNEKTSFTTSYCRLVSIKKVRNYYHKNGNWC